MYIGRTCSTSFLSSRTVIMSLAASLASGHVAPWAGLDGRLLFAQISTAMFLLHLTWHCLVHSMLVIELAVASGCRS